MRGWIEEDLEGVFLSCVMKGAEEAVGLQNGGFGMVVVTMQLTEAEPLLQA